MPNILTDEADEDADDATSNISSYLYYLSDGVCGTFNAIVWDAMVSKPLLLSPAGIEYRPQ